MKAAFQNPYFGLFPFSGLYQYVRYAARCESGIALASVFPAHELHVPQRISAT